MIETTSVLTPEWPILRITGPDAATWLNGIVTCDVTRVVPERGEWGLLLTKTGKIAAELLVLGRSDDLWVCVCGGDAARVRETLDHYLVMEDAELRDAPELGALVLIGPQAAARGHAVSQGPKEPDSTEVFSALPWAEGLAVARILPKASLATGREQLVAAGASPLDGFPAELRFALGLPSYGVDYGEKDNPHEAALERRAVSWSKGCYLGQEVVCMQDMRGKVKRRLVRLDLLDLVDGADGAGASDSSGAEPSGWEQGSAVLGPAGESAGELRSVAPSSALAMLGAPWFEPGTQVTVSGRTARVASLTAERAAE
ncbi:MAG TPA: hypothetical protein VLC09_20070 [Polyangiaceae bacterium]|nr:hypothetical protein [Polyangiaceae bacterium]